RAADDVFTTSEDTPLTVAAPGLLANDSDPNGDTLEAALDTGPANGRVQVGADGSFLYTPNANFNGTDSVTYRVGAARGGPAPAPAPPPLTAVNAAPTAAADSATTNEDVAVTISVLGNDTDVDGDPLTVTAATAGAHGTTAVNADGTVTY